MPPNYETAVAKTASTSFAIADEAGPPRDIYSQSTAILIVEGAYRGGGWQNVSDQGRASEKVLREELEQRGYHVLVWRDLTGAELKSVLANVVQNLGYDLRARLFIYYFGHGTTLEGEDDVSATRGYLVPVDAPDPVRDEKGFRAKAEPIAYLRSIAHEMTAKHVFIALEACRAGSIFTATLGGVPKPNPRGYLFSNQLQQNARQILTAGDASQDVPATGIFTAVLAEGLTEADTNEDGFVTGSELATYVTLNVPQRTTNNSLNPEYENDGRGDMIVGPTLKPPKLVVPPRQRSMRLARAAQVQTPAPAPLPAAAPIAPWPDAAAPADILLANAGAYPDTVIPPTTPFTGYTAARLRGRTTEICLGIVEFEQAFRADTKKIATDAANSSASFAVVQNHLEDRKEVESQEFVQKYLQEIRSLHFELLNRLKIGRQVRTSAIFSDGAADAINSGLLNGPAPASDLCAYLNSLARHLN